MGIRSGKPWVRNDDTGMSDGGMRADAMKRETRLLIPPVNLYARKQYILFFCLSASLLMSFFKAFGILFGFPLDAKRVCS